MPLSHNPGPWILFLNRSGSKVLLNTMCKINFHWHLKVKKFFLIFAVLKSNRYHILLSRWYSMEGKIYIFLSSIHISQSWQYCCLGSPTGIMSDGNSGALPLWEGVFCFFNLFNVFTPVLQFMLIRHFECQLLVVGVWGGGVNLRLFSKGTLNNFFLKRVQYDKEVWKPLPSSC